MISGFNTDIVHDGTVFHVQTEDKGRSNPVVVSLIYVGGQVVVSKQNDYQALLDNDGTDKEIADLMDRQHKVMIAAIKAGKFDEQLATMFDSQEVDVVPGPGDTGVDLQQPTDSGLKRAMKVGDAIDTSVSLDQVILGYLSAEAERDRLVLAMDENGDLAPGHKAFLALKATSSQTGNPVVGAKVEVKLISTVREPQILIEGETDKDGEAFLNVQIPVLKDATAALIITASSDLGQAELKYLL